MEPKVIVSKEEYREALNELERLMDLQPERGGSDWDRLQLFSTLIEAYESKTFPFETPDPIDAILYRMEEQGLKQRDLVPFIGSKSKVSEVLSRKRPLTLAMIRKLHDELQIPLEALVAKAGIEPKQNRFRLAEGGECVMCVAEDTEPPMPRRRKPALK
jgi:HTH-type transcriptional regulator / antitoxin HigA